MELTKTQKEYIQDIVDLVNSNKNLDIFNELVSPNNIYVAFCFLSTGKIFSKYHTAPRNILEVNGCKSPEIDILMKSILQGIIVGFVNIKKILFTDTSYEEGVRKLILWKASVDEMLNRYPYLLSTYCQFAALYYNAYGCYLAEIKQDVEQAQSNFLLGALYQLIELSSLIYKKNALVIKQWINKGLGTIYNYNLICSNCNQIHYFSSKIRLSFILSFICSYFLAFYDNDVFSNSIYKGWLQHIHDFLSYIIYENKEKDIIPFLISWRSKFESCFCEDMLNGQKPDSFKPVLEELIVNIGYFESIDDLSDAIYADL